MNGLKIGSIYIFHKCLFDFNLSGSNLAPVLDKKYSNYY